MTFLVDASGETKSVTLSDYLVLDMRKKFIVSIEFPKLTDNHRFRTFKVIFNVKSYLCHIIR
jgi:hypothetical protein